MACAETPPGMWNGKFESWTAHFQQHATAQVVFGDDGASLKAMQTDVAGRRLCDELYPIAALCADLLHTIMLLVG